jgi:hypothetical protein
MENFDLVGLDASKAEAVRAIAFTVANLIETSHERAKWEARLEALRQSYAMYGRTEQMTLESARIKADLAKFAIEKAAEKENDNGEIVRIFELYCSDTDDYLGKAIEVIAFNYAPR